MGQIQSVMVEIQSFMIQIWCQFDAVHIDVLTFPVPSESDIRVESHVPLYMVSLC